MNAVQREKPLGKMEKKQTEDSHKINTGQKKKRFKMRVDTTGEL